MRVLFFNPAVANLKKTRIVLLVRVIVGEISVIANRNFQIVLNRIDINCVSQNVAVHRNQKGRAAGIKPFHEHRAAKAHERVARFRKVRNDLLFCLRRFFRFFVVNVFHKSVTRKFQVPQFFKHFF